MKSVATARQMDRNLRDIDIEVMKSQFKKFLQRLYTLTKDKSVEQLENIDAKELLLYFISEETCYNGIEMIMKASAKIPRITSSYDFFVVKNSLFVS